MKFLSAFTLAPVAIAGASLLFANGVQAAGDGPCHAKSFKTEMVRESCKRGGQKAAKDDMKQWSKTVKSKTCTECHSKLAPAYPLKADGLERYRRLGGK